MSVVTKATIDESRRAEMMLSTIVAYDFYSGILLNSVLRRVSTSANSSPFSTTT